MSYRNYDLQAIKDPQNIVVWLNDLKKIVALCLIFYLKLVSDRMETYMNCYDFSNGQRSSYQFLKNFGNQIQNYF